MTKTKEPINVDMGLTELHRLTLNSMEDRLNRVKADAQKIERKPDREQIVKSADDKIAVVHDLHKRKKLAFGDFVFSQVRVGLLLLESSLAMRLYGVDSSQARTTSEALNRELESQCDEEYRRCFESD